VALSITFFFKTKRKRDLDNQNKLALDALAGIVYQDDAQITELCLKKQFDPRCRVLNSELQQRPRFRRNTFLVKRFLAKEDRHAVSTRTQ
jgi:hypothetical protein